MPPARKRTPSSVSVQVFESVEVFESITTKPDLKPIEDKPEYFLWEPIYKMYKHGRWLKHAPVLPGVYPIASRDGGLRGFIEVIHEPGEGLFYRYKRKESKIPSTLHSGWWWSVRVPSPQNAPKWDLATREERNTAELEKLHGELLEKKAEKKADREYRKLQRKLNRAKAEEGDK